MGDVARVQRDGTRPKVVYLCLESLQPGQAAATHVHAIANNLGLPVALFAVHAKADEPRRSALRRLSDYARLSWQAFIALRRADIAYVRAHPAALAFSTGARLLGKPIVHEVNGRTADIGVSHGLLPIATRLLTWIQHRQYRTASMLVTVTPGLQSWLRETIGSKIDVRLIPNGADSEEFKPGAVGGPTIAGDYAFFFGGLVAWHGVDTMLSAISDPSWPPNVKLVVAGHGPGLASVRAAAEHDQRVIALGYLPKPDIAGLAARALVNLCPIERHGRREEGGVAPLKLFESMASGRPVIASDLPYQAEVVRDNACGLVFPSANPVALAGAVAQVAADRTEATTMGARGRRAVEMQYDWRYRAADTAALLIECCPPLPSAVHP
ncbi:MULTISPECIES: glycosyltransferase family 4 protein [Bosea]|uniref:glycosyltransferase family 4 protein n=1 Tax=Bosea TaxID=85413 RepID=UPI00214F8538|nr:MULTISPECIES: glycosyltransferase family 4 protein [Bosea]MCR4523808.1 glycosyltransferase family 4 protein [Bosea sp. 47.2.35]MDR6830374.1 glycosyltransferase involved in cell wall biosynthesis [Bosea robiniae]MDR6897129.1 glycosyltransferase involved in cell wall biosynthesis [Bosea sp. BE109]MDR7140526.1 glycosyltransferase involved in cell wall biosynthesis [Bosea sp. BE168]MDR7177153.1 glycosyltransferase involved in cell wall biosynthesis [Bosea sp. BE271]